MSKTDTNQDMMFWIASWIKQIQTDPVEYVASYSLFKSLFEELCIVSLSDFVWDYYKTQDYVEHLRYKVII